MFHLQEHMAGRFKYYLLFTLLLFSQLNLLASNYLVIEAKAGDGISILLNRYDLAQYTCNKDTFLKINNLKPNDYLQLGKDYKLPILVEEFNGNSIRSSIDITDFNTALYIQHYNERMLEQGVRSEDFRKDKKLWVPIHALHCMSPADVEVKIKDEDVKEHLPSSDVTLRTENFPIFGEDYAQTPIISEKLKGQVYYLISGHGGPDPGATTTKDGHTLCEDEYAYDVTLRFARNLLQHSATVYVITRDNDGIRDQEYLDQDKDETVWYNQSIPLNHVRRLRQRSRKVNELYAKHKREGATLQRVIEIHIDSRYEEQKVDIFFYYYPGSETGKELANEMYTTIKREYDEHQANRGYKGVVKSRNLHTLRESIPPAVYIELGNITNDFDQRRLLIVNNRQAIANWLTLGVLSKNGN